MIVANVLDMWQVGWNTNLKHQSFVNYLKCCLYTYEKPNNFKASLWTLLQIRNLGMNTAWILFLASAV